MYCIGNALEEGKEERLEVREGYKNCTNEIERECNLVILNYSRNLS